MTAQFLFERLSAMTAEERARRVLFLRLDDPLLPPQARDDRYVAAVTVEGAAWLNFCEEARLAKPGETVWEWEDGE